MTYLLVRGISGGRDITDTPGHPRTSRHKPKIDNVPAQGTHEDNDEDEDEDEDWPAREILFILSKFQPDQFAICNLLKRLSGCSLDYDYDYDYEHEHDLTQKTRCRFLAENRTTGFVINKAVSI